MGKESIKYLQEEVRKLEQSDKNKMRREKWKELPRTARDQWRGVPKMDRSWKNGEVPITIDLQNPVWAQHLCFSLKDFYSDPVVFVENSLKIMIERFHMFDDDTFIMKQLPIWGTCGYEGSLFGMKVHCFDNKDPWLDHEIIIKEHSDLNKLKMPDFTTSGLMPEKIRLYEESCKLLDDDFEVLFPEWIRSTFAVALYLRGFEDILVDMMLEPSFVQELIAFINEARKKWFKDLESYLGTTVKKGNLFNDEVNSLSVSPQLYREIILPFEQDICDFHHGLHYWHSCGDATGLLEEIAKIPQIDLFNVGPWTSVDRAGQVFKDMAPLEICMNSQKDILEATEDQVRGKISKIIDDCLRNDVGGFALKVSGLNILHSLDYTLNQTMMWNKVTHSVIKEMLE